MKSSPPFAVVVNDDITQLSILTGLVRKAGIEIQAFTGAEDALAAMDPAAPPAVIVTDLYMPGIDGWRFCRLLRSSEYQAFNRVPILVVSATFTGDEPSRIVADLGADAYLSFPVDSRLFINKVSTLISGGQTTIYPRVLVVESDKTLAGAFRNSFDDNGYLADTVGTVRDASEAFRKNDYNVAVIAYHLPDGRGDSLLDEFRALQPDCVCIMMTSDPGPELALEWMKRGAAAYLRKPFQTDYLIELCARARRERSLLRVQDLLEVRTRELRESEEKYRIIADHASDWEYWLGPDGRYVHVSPSCEAITGYRADEFLLDAALAQKIVHPADCPVFHAHLEQVLNQSISGMKHTLLFRIMTKERETRWIEHTCRDVHRADGTWLGRRGSNRDITERMQAEEKLRKYEQFRRTVLDSLFAHVAVVDSRGNIVAVNEPWREFARQNGVPTLDGVAEGVNYLAVVRRAEKYGAELAGEVADGIEDMLAGRRDVFTAEYPCHSPTEHRWFAMQVMRLSDGSGGLVISHENITKRKCAENEKEKLHEQFLQAQKMESVGRLAGGVAHDFNNMLSVILGNVEMALMQVNQSHHLYDKLMGIWDAAGRSATLTRQLLTFARRQTVIPAVLDLNDTVAGMLKMLHRLIGENIELVWKPGTNLWPVKVDPGQIDQILANLLVNARDAVGEKGKVTIETADIVFDEEDCAGHHGFVPGAYVLLTVSDNGCGMEKEVLDRLFEPFFTTKEAGRGTGLGMATVYGIVRQNRGFIYVYSEPGMGTIFRIYLPRHDGRINGAQVAETAEMPGGQGETVLLVEDEPGFLNTVSGMLEALGYRVLAAGRPGEAIHLAGTHDGDIHLLITDMVMPEMNGRELGASIQLSNPGMKCLFMSGYAPDVIFQHGLPGENVQFIQKPFSMKDMAEKVRMALQCKEQTD